MTSSNPPPAGKPRPWRLDLAALLLLALGAVMALAVLGQDVHDSASLSYPPHPAPRNVLGKPGAWLALGLTRTLGVAVYVWLAAWFVLVLLLFLRRDLQRWALRLGGWLLFIPLLALTADRRPDLFPSPTLAGPGGSLGAWLSAWVGSRLRPFQEGLVLIVGAVIAGGLALDFLWKPLLVLSWRVGRSAGRVGRKRLSRKRQNIRKPTPKTRPTPDAPPATDPATPDIPIRHHAQAGFIPEKDLAPAKTRRTDAGEGTGRNPFGAYEMPPLDLLEDPAPFDYSAQDARLRERANLLEQVFADFGINVRVVGINTGPVITQFEVALETGLRVHKVTRLTEDVALNLKVPSVRMVAPIPGKNAVGVEVPNEHRADVRLKEVILAAGAKAARCKIPLFLGKDSEGRPLVYDLAEMPHLLIAGRTGTGKSVCMNAIILSVLMTRRPDDVRMVMIDPKNGVEMNEYGRIPHLMHPIVINMKKAEAILGWAVEKMEERYDLLSRARVRSIAAYNALKPGEVYRRIRPETEEEREQIPERMPYIVLFIDEMADLMMMMKKELEGHIIRLAQKSRAAGIHLVVATQKPTVDVITGLIKSNLPARVCFKVVNKSDSRVVLDEMGAEKLLGKGDMLFLPPGTSHLVRAQGAYASDEEIARVVDFLEVDNPCYAPELIQLSTTGGEGTGGLRDRLRERDPLYESAIEIIVREGRGSVSLLQRALGIGYGKAARFIDFMAEDGIVGAYNGSNAREVLYTPEQWSELHGGVIEE